MNTLNKKAKLAQHAPAGKGCTPADEVGQNKERTHNFWDVPQSKF